MLCRALLAAVVLSYVLCVLLLSGVQKEDLDEGTLRKLQRHNVNIDDINDQKLQEQCLGRTNAPITLATLTAETSTAKTIYAKEMLETDKSVGSLAGDTTPLEKIVEYLEYKYKDQRTKNLDSKGKTRQVQFKLTAITTLPPSTSWHDRYQKIEFDNFSTEKSVVTFTNKDDAKTNMNKKMENFMKVWQTNNDRISDTTLKESTTTNMIKEDYFSKNTKDVEYISKIVAEIMSKRQLDEGKSSVSAQHDLNETFRDAYHKKSAIKIKNETVLPANYYLNNCNLGNFYASKQGEKEKDETLNNLYNQLGYGGNMLNTDTTTNNNIYIACKRIEESEDNVPLDAVSVHDNTINHIIAKLKKAVQGFNGQDKENAKAFGTSLENQVKSLPFNRQNSNNNYKGRLNILDSESDKALETVIENQSNKLIFSQQSDPINTNNTFREIFNLFDYKSTKVFETTTNHPKSIFYYSKIDTTNVNKEKQANYARFVEENKKVWEKYFESLSNTQEPKLENEQTQTIIKTPNVRYEITKQGDHTADEEYKRWLYTFHKPLIKQQSNSLLNSRPDDYEKPTNILNSIHPDSNFGYQYRRPWLYGGQSSEQSKSRIKGNPEKILFKPKTYDNSMNTNDPNFKNTYRQKIPPYFIPLSKNLSFISIQEREMPENYREALVDNSDKPRLVQLNYWERPREVIEGNKKPANFVGWYQNKTPFIMKDRGFKQFESNRDKEISQNRQNNHQNKIVPLPEAEYKTNFAYFSNKQNHKQNPNEEHTEETQYYINSKSSKQFNYEYPSRPYEIPAKIPLSKVDAGKYQFTDFISKEKLSNENEKKLPTFPANVIKDIANSIKEIVLRDLKTTSNTEATPCTTVSTTTKTLPTTTTETTTSSITTTTTAVTTKPTSTTTTPPTTTTTATTTKYTTTGSLITTAKVDSLRVQDGSKAMEKLMEMFEKISSMKDKVVKLDNVENIQDIRYDTRATASKHSIFQTQEQTAQFKPENRVPYALHQTQMKVENRVRYNHHPVQLSHENRITYDAPTVQSKPENVIPYTQPLRTPENGIPRYGMKSPYYNSKIEYNPYVEREVLVSVTQKSKIKKVGHVITVQTNSGEIAPLKIELQKPMIQNIVLTTKPPTTDTYSDEIVNYRKPISSMARHKVENSRQAEVGNNREHESYVSRHTHRDAFMEKPKSRKIKNQRDFTEQYKPRGIQEIDRFHEKLERGDDWNAYKEAIPKRMQRPLAKKANYDDTHFRNFLHTQQKVNAMLEQILGSAKTTPVISAEILKPS